MSFHLAAYTTLLGTVANTDIPALQDDVLSINNNHFQLRKPYSLWKAYAASATLTRARFDSPTLRFYGNPYIRPVNVGTLPANNPNLYHLLDHPIMLPVREEIAIQATSGIAMGTEQFTALVWLMDHLVPIPAGNIFKVRFTSTTPAVANKWTSLVLTLETTLPTGDYWMVLSELQSTNAIAHRWIFNEQQERPGFLSITSLANRMFWQGYQHVYGTMGRFANDNLPILQTLANAADASHEGYLDIIKIAS